MALASTHHELDDLGDGHYRHTQHMKPIAFRRNGSLVRSVHTWAQGDASWPHTCLDAPMMVYTAADGMRRICPTRDPAVYVEIGAPYIKPAATWNKVNLGAATRSGNTISWTTAQARVEVVFGGHMIDLGAEFLGGWTPPGNQIAFPVGMQRLVRNGYEFQYNGQTVLSLRPFIVKDLANRDDVRPVTTQLVQVGGQWYALATLPSLAGMSRPYLDPTLTLQPDAAASVDTYIYQAGAGNNYGVADIVVLRGIDGSGRKSLLQFSMATMPVGATITAATLSLYLGSGTSEGAHSVAAHRGLVQWYEGVKNGAAPDGGVDGSTWAHRNAIGAVAWAGGAGGVGDTEYVAAAESTTNVSTYSAWYTWAVTTMTTAWYAGTATNYGIWLVDGTAGSAKYLSSSDNATAENRPKLAIDYTLPSAACMVRAPYWGRW